MFNQPQLLNGTPVVLNANLTEAGEPFKVRRTWRDRLFSRPWRPFQPHSWDSLQTPSRDIIKMPGGTLVMHPALWEEIERAISSGDNNG